MFPVVLLIETEPQGRVQFSAKLGVSQSALALRGATISPFPLILPARLSAFATSSSRGLKVSGYEGHYLEIMSRW
jgi:hypothetical protein